MDKSLIITRDLDHLKKSRKSEDETKRDFLKPRDFTVYLEANLNKSQVISKSAPGNQQAGYYCEVCDCVVKDSINFLDHINGKKHQRNQGMSMRIKRSTVDEVKNRFEMIKQKKEEALKEVSFDEKIKQLEEEEEKVRAQRKERRKERKRRFEPREEDIQNEEVSSLMGFSGFGGSRKNC